MGIKLETFEKKFEETFNETLIKNLYQAALSGAEQVWRPDELPKHDEVVAIKIIQVVANKIIQLRDFMHLIFREINEFNTPSLSYYGFATSCLEELGIGNPDFLSELENHPQKDKFTSPDTGLPILIEICKRHELDLDRWANLTYEKILEHWRERLPNLVRDATRIACQRVASIEVSECADLKDEEVTTEGNYAGNSFVKAVQDGQFLYAINRDTRSLTFVPRKGEKIVTRREGDKAILEIVPDKKKKS